MPQRRSELTVEPIWRRTRDYYARLNELRFSHPHIPVSELERFLNNPPSAEPAKPTPAPSKEKSMAQKIWPNLE
jgi:hypothetical protein